MFNDKSTHCEANRGGLDSTSLDRLGIGLRGQVNCFGSFILFLEDVVGWVGCQNGRFGLEPAELAGLGKNQPKSGFNTKLDWKT